MNYVDSLNLFGVPVKEIPCITGSGAPSTTTAGAVGSLYMDTDTGALYKCTAAANGIYTWTDFGGGTVTDEQLADAVEDYMEEHPVKDGSDYVITDADK